MAASNIEQFDEIAGKTFAMLYESFPIPIDLPLREYTGVEGVYANQEENELTHQARLVMSTLEWLQESGYVRAKVQHDFGLNRCVLTAKGLETLKVIPDSLTAPLGERLKDAVKQGGWEITRTLVSQVLSVGATIGINALK
ncbi:hypothetical protein [Aeromonas hydrophila]|uniref:hypothetical protein n=1 Tax=Aeromonas hydrophila TaxID=644 RepID=UPI001FC8ADAE|nr:hypothetical protein [Aeromonas hydrophila]GKQ95995.1 hypothetical protein KAM461_02450 [Aeromonas hydrophila]